MLPANIISIYGISRGHGKHQQSAGQSPVIMLQGDQAQSANCTCCLEMGVTFTVSLNIFHGVKLWSTCSTIKHKHTHY